jgi:hypothetical protein
LISVIFPGTLVELGPEAFAGCTALQTADLISTKLSVIPDHAFVRCSSLRSLLFPTSLKSIRGSIFAECGGLTQPSLVFLLSLADIGGSAFQNCVRLAQVGLPPILLSFDSSAFRNCIGLRTLTIGGSITSCGVQIFESTGAVTKLEFTGTDITKVNCDVLNPVLAESVVVTAPHWTARSLCGHPISSRVPSEPTQTPDQSTPLAEWQIALIVVGTVAIVAAIASLIWARCLRRDALPPDESLLSGTQSKGYETSITLLYRLGSSISSVKWPNDRYNSDWLEFAAVYQIFRVFRSSIITSREEWNRKFGFSIAER